MIHGHQFRIFRIFLRGAILTYKMDGSLIVSGSEWIFEKTEVLNLSFPNIFFHSTISIHNFVLNIE